MITFSAIFMYIFGEKVAFFSGKPMLINVMIHIDLAVWHSGNRVRL
jgi:hypothetical protein